MIFSVATKNIRKRIITTAVVMIIAICAGIVLTLLASDRYGSIQKDGRSISLRAENTQDISRIGSALSLPIGNTPSKIVGVTIPERFDDVYEQYNDLQISSGLDLRSYAGKKAQLYIYDLGGFGGAEKAAATFIVSSGRVIGGDISDCEYGGFMKGLL